MINSEEVVIFMSVLFRDTKAVQIETNDPSYAPEGVPMDIGPSLPSIRQHYKNLQLRAYRYQGAKGYTHRYYDDAESGIAFSYLYGRDGEKSTPNAIIVHRVGHYVIPQAGGKRFKLSRQAINNSRTIYCTCPPTASATLRRSAACARPDHI